MRALVSGRGRRRRGRGQGVRVRLCAHDGKHLQRHSANSGLPSHGSNLRQALILMCTLESQGSLPSEKRTPWLREGHFCNGRIFYLLPGDVDGTDSRQLQTCVPKAQRFRHVDLHSHHGLSGSLKVARCTERFVGSP